MFVVTVIVPELKETPVIISFPWSRTFSMFSRLDENL